MNRPYVALAIAAGVAACLSAACSQLGNIATISSAAQTIATAPTSGGTAAAAASAAASGALTASPEAEDELKPDRSCSRPLEKFDITEKAIEYGGTAGQLRLQRLVATDFKYSDLTPEDKKFLHFLAVTTIWVPLDVETYLARTYESAAGKPAPLKPLQRAAVATDKERLKLFQDQVLGFPGDVRFEVHNDLADGAYAELGALIVTSPTFLTLMDENPQARDLVLSHELSHVYKRHRLKQLQSRMVATSSGFDLAKKLMGSSLSQASSNPLSMLAFAATTGPALWDFYRQADLAFTKEQELEADACAGIWMQRAKVDACAAWRGFVKIAPKDGAYAETHPTTAEREENYRRVNGAACTTEGGKQGTTEAGRQGATAKPVPGVAGASAPKAAPKPAPAPKRPASAASAASSSRP
jgi:hypothetical protein